jgi:EPS-associated MarR family transcriptional regulator
MYNYEQGIHYRLLKMLSKEPNVTQRDMAKRMGISLGKMNYCVTELAAKGWIKIIRFKSAGNKTPYTYLLTPKGLEEKARMTLSFLKRKLAEYEEIKKQIRELHYEVEEEVLDDPDSELIVAVKSII